MADQENKNLSLQQKALRVVNTPRTRRAGRWLAIVFVLFGLFGYFAGPPIVKSVLLAELSKQLHRQVSVEGIDINPYALAVTVNGVSVKDDDGKEFVGFDQLYLNLSSFSVFQAGVVVDEFRLQGPRVRVARLAEGRYDISDLLDEWLKPSDSPTPRFSLNNIQILGGKVEFDDQPQGKHHEITEIDLKLPFVSSLPYQADIVVEPAFSAKFNGAPVLLAGKSKPFSGSHESELILDADRIDLANFRTYLPNAFPLRLQGGLVDSELKILFREQGQGVFSLALNGALHLSDLQLHTAEDHSLVGWKRLDLTLQSADLINRQFAIDLIHVDGLDGHLAVSKKGDLNLIELADRLAGKPTETSGAPAKAPVWSVAELRLTNGVVHWRDESNPKPVTGRLHNLEVSLHQLDSRMEAPIALKHMSYALDVGDILHVPKLEIREGKLDLKGHRVDLGEVAAHGAKARFIRNKAGKVEFVSTPVLRTLREVKAEYSDERPWVINLEKLDVADVALRFEDVNTTPAAVQAVDGLSVHAESFTTEPGKKSKLAVRARVNDKGSFKLDGSVQFKPLAANLGMDVVAIPLLPLQPYFTEYLNISLTKGVFSSKGDVAVQLDKDGLNGGYQGSMTLGDVLSVDKVNSADFLRWKSLYLGGMDIKLKPMSIAVGEISLADFYSRLIVSSEGKLNLMQIVKQADKTVEKLPEGAREGGAVPREKSTVADTQAKEVMPIRVGKVTLQGGTVNFTDRFIKPSYTVNMTKVGGRISGLSSAADTLADMELRGSYANTAPVQVVAKINPLSARSALDLKAEVRGVDLVPFSPYSGKYAGYNIEKGKLSLFVTYKLDKGQLLADNRVFLDQLTFGEKVNSPEATTLPVSLAVSLLKNGRGEIDINLPISGSLDDPQFSLGGVVVKVIVNLFVKAVTSPFALLGSLFGGGEELSNVEFEPGKVALSETAARKLDGLAKAIADRPALKLEIAGRVDPEADKEGLKRVAMEQAAKAEKLKELVKKGADTDSLDTIQLSAKEYPVYLQKAYKEAKFPKPRNLIGLQKDLPVEEMEKLMLTNLPVSEDDMVALAERRAETVQSWLVDEGKVPQDRLFIMPPKIEKADKDEAKAKGSRVDFSLR